MCLLYYFNSTKTDAVGAGDIVAAARVGDELTCTQFTCFNGTKLVLLTQVAGDIAVPPVLPATASVYLLYWYKSTITDAAGA
jgi:hypothetical protein